MFRHPVEYVESIRAVAKSMVNPGFNHKMFNCSFGGLKRFALKQFISVKDLDEDEDWIKTKQIFDSTDGMHFMDVRIFAALYCSNIAVVRQMIRLKNTTFFPISYSDLIEKTDQEMKRILSFCGIDESRQCDLPQTDAQCNTDLSIVFLKEFRSDLTEDEVEKVDSILDLCDLPPSKNFPTHGEDFEKYILYPSFEPNTNV